jgi:hypothetical protein
MPLSINLKESGLNLEDYALRVRNRRGLMAVLGAEGVRQVQANFQKLEGRGNRLGAPSTGYYTDAARLTSSQVTSDFAATVSINKVGIRLHSLGGEVTPVTKKWLTIPAIPAAHGRKAESFGNTLWLMKKQGVPIALARTIGEPKDHKFEVVYWLRKSVKHRADPETLPNLGDLATSLRDRAASYYQREATRS